ncbi:MAG: hypothetical protein O2955_20665 [Planctomycetota bacterium]|nr:hypothetical protein [Planctomycetota bacterium]MDA1214923.1 hypothetical protein [Planctomycetota bacterium]
MLHFTCDLCGSPMNDHRYVVKVSVYPAFDPEEITEDDVEADHLKDVSDVLEQMEASGKLELEDCSAKSLRFDLCPECRKKYLKDPLARDSGRRLKFSQN